MTTKTLYKLSEKIFKNTFPNETDAFYDLQIFNSIAKTITNIHRKFLVFFKENFSYPIDFLNYPIDERLKLIECFYYYSREYNSKFLTSICKVNLDGEEIFKFKKFYLDFFEVNNFHSLSSENIEFLKQFSHRNIMLNNEYSLNEKFKYIKSRLEYLYIIPASSESLYLIEDFGSDIIIQSCIKLISKENIPDMKKRIDILIFFDDFLKEYISCIPDDTPINSYNLDSNLIKDFFNLIFFIEKSIYLKEYLNIYTVLESDFNNSYYFHINETARSNKRFISDKNKVFIPDEELYFLVNFFKNQNSVKKNELKKFKKNKLIIETFIFIFRTKHNRRLSERYLQHFRGVYNEIFNSNFSINRNKISTIVKKFIINSKFTQEELKYIKDIFPNDYSYNKNYLKSANEFENLKKIFFSHGNDYPYKIHEKIFLFSLLIRNEFFSIAPQDYDFNSGLTNKEYMFLREKISKGMYLEREEFDEYFYKNSIQKSLTEITLKIYTNDNISSSTKKLINFYLESFLALENYTLKK